VLRLERPVYLRILSHCWDSYPEEGCGLLGGEPATGLTSRCYPARNIAASARVYTVDPREHLRASLDAEKAGLELLGVFHSHTHTDAYPSPTDVQQAPDPEWHYVIVSLRDVAPMLRSFRIVDGNVEEEPVIVEGQREPAG
jgi:[CysO sulfur-carrier protein]-S-L-cysteine hydrolase